MYSALNKVGNNPLKKWLINLIYDGWGESPAPVHPRTTARGRGEAQEVGNRGVCVCGGGVGREREKWMRGTERNSEESPQQNFCSIQAEQTGLSPVLPAWLLSCCTTNCCCCCCVKIVWRKQRRLSAWEKMDGLIRTWCRHRTSLIILILLHVAAAQSGKVSS